MTSRPTPCASSPGRFKLPPRVPYDPGDGKFPVFPPRGDMQNPLYLYGPGYLASLARHFGGSPETIAVMGEIPVGCDLRQRLGLRVPDLTIAFGVDRRRIISDRGYSIEDQGKPPDFVLEVASENTGQRDIREKRENYAAFGIPEYWRFDPSGGLYHGALLAGDRLTGGAYQPIDIVRVDDTHHWGRSEVLGLDLCWEEELLRWYDPATRRYLRTFDEADEERIAAEERVRQLEEEIRRLRG